MPRGGTAVTPNGEVNVAWQESRFGGAGFEIRSAHTVNGGGSWASLKGDMPTSPVHDMKIHARVLIRNGEP